MLICLGMQRSRARSEELLMRPLVTIAIALSAISLPGSGRQAPHYRGRSHHGLLQGYLHHQGDRLRPWHLGRPRAARRTVIRTNGGGRDKRRDREDQAPLSTPAPSASAPSLSPPSYALTTNLFFAAIAAYIGTAGASRIWR
jgi:hypothetical protein